MKKSLLIFSLLSITLFALPASPSWIGLMGFSSHGNKTTTYKLGGAEFEEKSTTTLSGMQITGSIYPGSSPFGIGLQLGSAKMLKATNGSSDEDVSDYPLTLSGSVSGLYRLGVSEKVVFEFGLGLQSEKMTKAANSGGSEVIFSLHSLGLLTSANLLIGLSDNFSLVGGITGLSNLKTNGRVTSGSFAYDKDFKVSGYALQGQIGVAFNL